jgi:uncharacterized protein YndB with AHSA1/START domain
MYAFESSVFINRPPQEVFDYVTNPANNAQWQSGTESSSWTSDGPPGIGATFKGVGQLMGRKIEAAFDVTSWDRPYQWSFKSISGPIPTRNTTRFEAQGDGTLVVHATQIELAGVFQLAEALAGKQLEKTYESNNATLKRLLEAGQAQPAR